MRRNMIRQETHQRKVKGGGNHEGSRGLNIISEAEKSFFYRPNLGIWPDKTGVF